MLKFSKFNAAGQALETYAARPGIWQDTPAICKVLFTLCYIVAVVSMPRYNWPGLIPFMVFPALMVSLAGVPWRLFLRRLLPLLPFVVLLGGVNILLDHQPVYYSANFSMTGGWASFVTLVFKAMLTVGAVLLLVAGTALNDVAGVLVKLRVPCLFVMQLLLTWRYAGLLANEAGNMMAAYQLRGGGRRGIHIGRWPQFVGLFMLRAINRARMVSNAMVCRLFDIRRIHYEQPKCKWYQVLFWCAACALCFVLRIWV